LLDPYVQLAQESYGNIGYLQGLWRYRGFVPETAATVTAAHVPEESAAGSPR
jgi:hypothetical protein